ncbi:MAG: hypothetical protein ACYTFY_12775 [Planctomycetota bacterium]|jgi:hypothetical protein
MADNELRAYLSDELANKQERYNRVQEYLNANHSFSIQIKTIQGRKYYYKKYRKGKKVITDYIGPVTTDISKLKEAVEKIKQLKKENRDLAKEIKILKKQLELTKKA